MHRRARLEVCEACTSASKCDHMTFPGRPDYHTLLNHYYSFPAKIVTKLYVWTDLERAWPTVMIWCSMHFEWILNEFWMHFEWILNAFWIFKLNNINTKIYLLHWHTSDTMLNSTYLNNEAIDNCNKWLYITINACSISNIFFIWEQCYVQNWENDSIKLKLRSFAWIVKYLA